MSEGKIVIGDLKYLIERLRFDANSHENQRLPIEVLQIRQHAFTENVVVVEWASEGEASVDHHVVKSLIELTGDL